MSTADFTSLVHQTVGLPVLKAKIFQWLSTIQVAYRSTCRTHRVGLLGSPLESLVDADELAGANPSSD
jgi:hypothetical protein